MCGACRARSEAAKKVQQPSPVSQRPLPQSQPTGTRNEGARSAITNLKYGKR